MKIALKTFDWLFDLVYVNGEFVTRMVYGLLIGLYISFVYLFEGERIGLNSNPVLYVICAIALLLLALRLFHAVLLERKLLREAGIYCAPYLVGIVPPLLACTVLR
jgi:hypothetical protein